MELLNYIVPQLSLLINWTACKRYVTFFCILTWHVFISSQATYSFLSKRSDRDSLRLNETILEFKVVNTLSAFYEKLFQEYIILIKLAIENIFQTRT